MLIDIFYKSFSDVMFLAVFFSNTFQNKSVYDIHLYRRH